LFVMRSAYNINNWPTRAGYSEKPYRTLMAAPASSTGFFCRVVDPDWFNTDPDPAFLPNGSKLKQNFRRQFLSQICLKSKFESNQIKNTGVIHKKFFNNYLLLFYTFLVVNIFLKNN
jgi:hypothetical protein